MIKNIEVIYEDQDLAVINKPAGVVVNDAETVQEETIQGWWKSQFPGNIDWEGMVPTDFVVEYGSPESIFEERGGIVHRLDRETSGVMVLAKNPGSLVNLLRQFRLRQTQKMYQALVHGKFTVLEDTISLPLKRSPENRTKFAVDPEGRAAETKYQVTQLYSGLKPVEMLEDPAILAETEKIRNFRKKVTNSYQGFSLVKCWPKTGRTHQIRVHLSHLRHPIVADPTYLGKKREVLDRLWCPRLFLHATELQFTHPRTAVLQTFTAKLPTDLKKVLSYLVEIA